MNTPPDDVSVKFFTKIGYVLRPVSEAGSGATGWSLSQPNGQGTSDYETLSDLWEHWAPRGDQHIQDDRALSHLMGKFEDASPELKGQIVAAVQDYALSPFCCKKESISLLTELSENSQDEDPPRYSSEWLDAIQKIVDQSGGGYGFSARAGLAFGLSKQQFDLDISTSRKIR